MKKVLLFLFAIVSSNVSFGQENVVKIQADISNRNGDVLYVKNNKTIIKEIKVDGTSHFNAAFDVKEGMYQLYDGKEYTEIFLKNGFDLLLTMDAEKFDESIVYTGKGALENNYLAQKIRNESGFNFEDLLASTPEVFAEKLTQKQSIAISNLEKEMYNPVFVEIQKKAISSEVVELSSFYKEKQLQLKLNNSQSPSFNYENHAGGKTKLEDLKGKYVYIDVWATWCGPCRTEIPFLKKIEEKYHNKKIAFVSISVDEQKDYEKWKTFVVDKQLGGIQLFADKNWMSIFIKAYGINSIPRFILIDPTGKVISADADRPSSPKLQDQLDSLLN
jgi:thiol-disulfide isomerase/thioredoxin